MGLYRRKICQPNRLPGTVLLFGSPGREEFGPIRHQLRQSVQNAGAGLLEINLFPKSISLSDLPNEKKQSILAAVCLESFPGQWPAAFFYSLRTLFPLAPILLLAGDLCEGEGRTGELPSGLVRFYRREWERFWKKEWDKFLISRTGRFALPPTALDEDYFLNCSPEKHFSAADAASLRMAIPFPGAKEKDFREIFPPVCIIAPNDFAMERLLAERSRRQKKRSEAFTADSLLAAQTTRTGVPEQIQYDSIAPAAADEFPVIEKLAQAFPDTEIHLWLFAPRYEDEQLFKKLTNVRIFSKPFDLIHS